MRTNAKGKCKRRRPELTVGSKPECAPGPPRIQLPVLVTSPTQWHCLHSTNSSRAFGEPHRVQLQQIKELRLVVEVFVVAISFLIKPNNNCLYSLSHQVRFGGS